VLRWSLLLLLLVVAGLAGSFFLPGTAVQRLFGQPIAALLEGMGAPGWNTQRPVEPSPPDAEKQPDLNFAGLIKEKELLAQKLEDAEAQRKKAEDEKAEADKDKKAAEEQFRAAEKRAKKAEDDLEKLDTAKGGNVKELNKVRADLKEAKADLQKAKEKAAEEVAEAKKLVAKESVRANEAADNLKVAKKEKDDAARRLSEAEEKLAQAEKEATASKAKETEARAESAKLKEKLKLIDRSSMQTMICFLLYNRTDAAISFERRYLTRTGEWTEWEKSKIKQNYRIRVQSLDGVLAIQVRFDNERGPQTVDIDGQVFRKGKRNPSFEQIDCWYEFKKSGGELKLMRIPRE
jgi:hypothetical protein